VTDVCEHVSFPADEAVFVRPGKGAPDQVLVRCPCCGATAWREPDDDLVGDDCPYCEIGTVPS
jgi:hypothetical protein